MLRCADFWSEVIWSNTQSFGSLHLALAASTEYLNIMFSDFWLRHSSAEKIISCTANLWGYESNATNLAVETKSKTQFLEPFYAKQISVKPLSYLFFQKKRKKENRNPSFSFYSLTWADFDTGHNLRPNVSFFADSALTLILDLRFQQCSEPLVEFAPSPIGHFASLPYLVSCDSGEIQPPYNRHIWTSYKYKSLLVYQACTNWAETVSPSILLLNALT